MDCLFVTCEFIHVKFYNLGAKHTNIGIEFIPELS